MPTDRCEGEYYTFRLEFIIVETFYEFWEITKSHFSDSFLEIKMN